MPSAFSASERERITDKLLSTGYDLFTRQGMRKTSLDELVAPAGIAKSTFYQFFDSKESLYLELMLRETAEVKRRVIDGGLLAAPDVREALRRFLHTTLDELAANPLWRRLTTHPEEMAAVARRLDPSRVTSSDNPAVALTTYVEEQRRARRLIDAEASVIVGVLQAVLLLPLHADRLGSPDDYPKVVDLLIDIVAAGLTVPRPKTKE
jgi:AcrR family transcriptional regulator